jgi:hypothetical protein
MIGQIVKRQAHDVPEVHDERGAIVCRVLGRSQEVQSFMSALSYLLPLPLPDRFRVEFLKLRQSIDWTERYELDLIVFQVASLGDDNQPCSRQFFLCYFLLDRFSSEKGQKALLQHIALRQFAPAN